MMDLPGGGAQLCTSQHTSDVFAPDGYGGYSSAGNNTSAALMRTGTGMSDTFVMIARDGTVSTFFGTYSGITTPGRLQSIVDRFGNSTTFTWTVMGGQIRLATVTDRYSRVSTFSYLDAAHNYRLDYIVDFDNRYINFQYDTSGRLVAVVQPSITRGANDDANAFPNGNAYVFQYDTANRLIAIYYPNQVAPYVVATRTVEVSTVYSSAKPRCQFTYNLDSTSPYFGTVTYATVGDPASDVGGTYAFTYTTSGLPSNTMYPTGTIVSRTTVVDPNGNQTYYDFTGSGMLAHKEVLANRGKNDLEASSWETWTLYNTHNQPLVIVMPEGNSILYAYEDETNTITFGLGATPYGRRIGLLKTVTRLPGNTYGIPYSRTGSGPTGGVQNRLTSRQFIDPLFGQVCARIEERGNPIDVVSSANVYFSPQNGGTAASDSNRDRYTTVNHLDYQKDTAATVQADTDLQLLLFPGLSSGDAATRIGDLITFVNNQMSETDGTGGITAGFQMPIGDVNGEGTGDGTSYSARHQGAVVKIARPSVLQLVPIGEGSYPNEVIADSPFAYYRLGELSGTTAIDSSGNGNNGTYTNGVVLGEAGAIQDDPNTAIQFNAATGSFVALPTIALDGDFTLEAWTNFNYTPTNGDEPFGNRGAPDTNFYANHYRLYTGSGDAIVSDTPVTLNIWEHYVITRSGTTLTLYRNGVQHGTGTYSDTFTLSSLGWGNVGPDGNFLLDEAAIYTHALSPDRILTHYQLGSGATPWVSSEQSRVELFTTSAMGYQTTATDSEGNLTVTVRYPFNDPDGQSGYTTPGLSTQQYGFVKEVHVDADPATVMTLVGSYGDMITFIGNKIGRTNTPGSYLNLVTKYLPSSGTGSGCSSCAYDPLGNPLSMTDPNGFTTLYDRNEVGEVYRTTTDAPYSQQVETYYDSNRNVIQVDTQDLQVTYNSTDPTDPSWAQFTPTGSGSIANLPTHAGPGDSSMRSGWFSNMFTYDLLDNKTEDDIDATGSMVSSLVTTYLHDPNQNLIKIVKPELNVVEHDYDERDLRIATRVGYDASISQPGAVTVMVYDGNGNVLGTISPVVRGNMMQIIVPSSPPTGGNFTLTFNGVTTASIAGVTGGTPASAVQSALYNLSNINNGVGTSNVQVTGAAGGPYTVTFVNALGGSFQPLLTVASNTTGAPINTYFVSSSYVMSNLSTSLTATIDNAFSSGSALIHTGDYVAANTYDGFDRLIQSTDAAGGTIANTFDPGGRTIASQMSGTTGGQTPVDRTGSANTLLSSSASNFDEAGRAYEQLQFVFLRTFVSGTPPPTYTLPSARPVYFTGNGLATNSTTNSNTGTVTLTTGGGPDPSYVLSRAVFDRSSRTANSAADNGAITGYGYDGANRQIKLTDALGNQVSNTFDANGNVIGSTRIELCTISGVSTVESFASQMRYDLLNRLIVLIQQGPDGNIDPNPADSGNLSLFTYFGYDSRNNRTNLVDPKGNTTIWTFDGASRQLTNNRTLRSGGVGTGGPTSTVTTTSFYDGNSRLIKLTDANGGFTTWTYDTLDRQQVMTFYDGSIRTNTFDLANDLIGYVDENGSSFTNTFDVLGRKTTVAIDLAANVVGTSAQSFQYDGMSRMTLATDTAGSFTAGVGFYFDSLGRVIEEAQSYGD